MGLLNDSKCVLEIMDIIKQLFRLLRGIQPTQPGNGGGSSLGKLTHIGQKPEQHTAQNQQINDTKYKKFSPIIKVRYRKPSIHITSMKHCSTVNSTLVMKYTSFKAKTNTFC